MHFGWEGAMPAASLETTLELWSATLRQAKQRIRPLFAAPPVAASANAFLDGLLGAERRKTSWMRAEAAGDPGPWRQQAILGRSRWDADALRDVVRDYVVETLAAPDAVLVIDETGFLKQGNASVGWADNTPALRARSRTARSGCLPLTPPTRAMPSLTDSSICRKPGPAIQHGCGPPTCRRTPLSRPSRSWRLA